MRAPWVSCAKRCHTIGWLIIASKRSIMPCLPHLDRLLMLYSLVMTKTQTPLSYYSRWPAAETKQRCGDCVYGCSGNVFADPGAHPQVPHEPKEKITSQLCPSGSPHKQVNSCQKWVENEEANLSSLTEHWLRAGQKQTSITPEHTSIDCTPAERIRPHWAPLRQRDVGSFAWYLWGRTLPRRKAD